MIRYPHEKKGGNFVAQSIKLFSDFINDNGLIALPLLRRSFTWSNNREQVAMSRLTGFCYPRSGMSILIVSFRRLFQG